MLGQACKTRVQRGLDITARSTLMRGPCAAWREERARASWLRAPFTLYGAGGTAQRSGDSSQVGFGPRRLRPGFGEPWAGLALGVAPLCPGELGGRPGNSPLPTPASPGTAGPSAARSGLWRQALGCEPGPRFAPFRSQPAPGAVGARGGDAVCAFAGRAAVPSALRDAGGNRPFTAATRYLACGISDLRDVKCGVKDQAGFEEFTAFSVFIHVFSSSTEGHKSFSCMQK